MATTGRRIRHSTSTPRRWLARAAGSSTQVYSKKPANIGEAEAIERHLMRGETVTWCDQGYAWVEQDAVHWFYAAAFVLVVLPYLIVRFTARVRGASEARRAIDGRRRLAG
jgi:hypothetical protein